MEYKDGQLLTYVSVKDLKSAIHVPLKYVDLHTTQPHSTGLETACIGGIVSAFFIQEIPPALPSVHTYSCLSLKQLVLLAIWLFIWHPKYSLIRYLLEKWFPFQGERSCSCPLNPLIQPRPPFIFTFLRVFSSSQALILTPYFSERKF